MKTYSDIDLKTIRQVCNLDFAHYTYGRGQCTCCYGPFDMPARYWRNSKKPVEVVDYVGSERSKVYHYELKGKRICKDEISYILFKNACNAGGRVKKEDVIDNFTCISYRFKNLAQKKNVCQMLLDQLDSDYVMAFPTIDANCIVLYHKKRLFNRTEEEQKGYIFYEFGSQIVEKH